jgi:hypothetical protein
VSNRPGAVLWYGLVIKPTKELLVELGSPEHGDIALALYELFKMSVPEAQVFTVRVYDSLFYAIGVEGFVYETGDVDDTVIQIIDPLTRPPLEVREGIKKRLKIINFDFKHPDHQFGWRLATVFA